MMSSTHHDNKSALTVLFVGTPQVNIEDAVQASCNRPVTIDVVSDGREAIQWLNETRETATNHGTPDLILLEFGFEPPDGETLVHAIKSSPRLETVPVVVLTADGTGAETAHEHEENARVTAPGAPEAYAELMRSIGEFWFEWVHYSSESLFTDET
jgi:CheY-like chemotaxis protein